MAKRKGNYPHPSEKSLANLKNWPKGVSGNPAGRPKLPFRKLKEIAEEILNEPDEATKQSKLEKVLRTWLQMAEDGDLKAGEMLFDRAYGKPVQHIESQVDLNEVKPPIEWSDE